MRANVEICLAHQQVRKVLRLLPLLRGDSSLPFFCAGPLLSNSLKLGANSLKLGALFRRPPYRRAIRIQQDPGPDSKSRSVQDVDNGQNRYRARLRFHYLVVTRTIHDGRPDRARIPS